MWTYKFGTSIRYLWPVCLIDLGSHKSFLSKYKISIMYGLFWLKQILRLNILCYFNSVHLIWACSWTQFYSLIVYTYPFTSNDWSFFYQEHHRCIQVKQNTNIYQNVFCVFRCPMCTKSWNLLTIRLSKQHFSERTLVDRSNSTGTQ